MYKSFFDKSQIYPLLNKDTNWIDSFARGKGFTFGYCPVCGHLTKFSEFTENLRESGKCYFCNSSNRNRQMTVLLMKSLEEIQGQKYSSLRDFSVYGLKGKKSSTVSIFNTEATGCIHKYLCTLDNYQASEYFGIHHTSGEYLNGILHQDLMNTSFEPDSFDIVLSSDVFEHIPKPYKGFEEIYRILKPGGRHIFTVPFYGDRYLDEVRSLINEDGVLENLLPPIYHGDPLRPEGILVYVIFSLEMLVRLRKLGYETRLYNVRNAWNGILGDNALIFEAIKKRCDK